MNSAALAARIRLQHSRSADSRFVLDASIGIPSGVTILFGPSGAGKSTLLDCVAGLLRPQSGSIALGEDTWFDSQLGIDLPPGRRRVAYVSQSLALFPHLSAEANVAYGLLDLPPNERHGRVAEILEAFRVEKLRSHKPGELSGGEKQRVALARSLVTQPQLLLLDEPLTGLDAGWKSSIMNDLRVWNSQRNIPILYVTHNREEVDVLGDRLIVLENGRVVGSGDPRQVLDAPCRSRLAHASGFENLLEAVVLDLRPDDGVMRVRLTPGSTEIEVPLYHVAPGDRVRIAVRAGDILIAAEPPRGLSARNILEGKIISIEQRGSLVLLQVDCGASLAVHVTPGAVRALELAPQKKVWAVVKTHSCHLVQD